MSEATVVQPQSKGTQKDRQDVAIRVLVDITANEFTELGASIGHDILERIKVGEKKYGERLTTFNGRDAVIDLYQELLDGLVYTKQALLELGDDVESAKWQTLRIVYRQQLGSVKRVKGLLNKTGESIERTDKA